MVQKYTTCVLVLWNIIFSWAMTFRQFFHGNAHFWILSRISMFQNLDFVFVDI